MGKYYNVPSNIILQDQYGNTNTFEKVKAVDLPTDDNGIQTFHDLMLLKPYYFKSTGEDGVVEIVVELNLLFASAGNYGIASVVSNVTIEENGYLGENGNYFMGLLFTDKELTQGERYTLNYIFNTRGGA